MSEIIFAAGQLMMISVTIRDEIVFWGNAELAALHVLCLSVFLSHLFCNSDHTPRRPDIRAGFLLVI
jgi:hypothetical protein